MSHLVEPEEDVADDTESRTRSELHWLFEEPRCKTTLAALDELTLPATLDTVTTVVARMESDEESIAQGDVDEVAASLHHVHLPKMDRLGVVRYDPERKRIE